VALVLAGILAQVVHSFWLYLTAATGSPDRLLELLFAHHGFVNAVVAWLSIIVTLCLPLFLFYAFRALAETLSPTLRARRLLKTWDVCGPTTYTVDDAGVRSAREGGVDTFMPWASFDGLRSDAAIAALTNRKRLKFFVPIAAFGAQQREVLAQIQSRISSNQVR